MAFVVSPDLVWQRGYTSRCDGCLRSTRCTVFTLNDLGSDRVPLCEHCVVHRVSKSTRETLLAYYSDGKGPTSAREQYIWLNSILDVVHSDTILAVQRRYYWSVERAKSSGYKTLEASVNEKGRGALWLAEWSGTPLWLKTLMRHVPGRRVRASGFFVEEKWAS